MPYQCAICGKKTTFGRQYTKRGLANRDRIVLKRLFQSGLPVAITLAGGYAKQVKDAVDIHFETVMSAVEFYRR